MGHYIREVVSYRVCSKINEHKGSQEVAIDPATAILIGKILIKAVLLIKNCKGSNPEREGVVRNPSRSDLGSLKKLVRKELGWFKYIFFGAKIIRALTEVSADMDNGELQTCGLYANDAETQNPNYYSNYTEL
jgi:hypothetical protein|tara:strand:+ start:453 stop:851 length:399 start_codon:yes stop_codon:yes gene_type:complete